jgi:phosphoribosylamine--glycine ligase
LCAVGLGAGVSQAQLQAYALLEPIHYSGMQFRHDIGYRAIARERADADGV